MYEELVAFLLGKKEEFTDEDLEEFMKLLADAFNAKPEYHLLEKFGLVESMMDKAEITSFEDRLIAGNKISSMFYFKVVNPVDEENKECAKETKRKRTLFGSKMTMEERVQEQERKLRNKKEAEKKVAETEAAVKSQLYTKKDKRVKSNEGIALTNVFDKQFEENAFKDDVKNILKEDLKQDKGSLFGGFSKLFKNPFEGESGEEEHEQIMNTTHNSEKRFDIGHIEDKPEESGPKYYFDLDLN